MIIVHRIHSFFWGSFLLFVCGCTDVQVHENRRSTTDIGVNEKISLILDRSSIKDIEDAYEMEEKIEACINKALNKLEPPVQTVSAEIFRNTAFPGIDYSSVPSSIESLTTLIKSDEFRKRIKPLGLRYLLALHTEYSTRNDSYGGCTGTLNGPPFCLAFIKWENETKLSACVLDLSNGCNAGEVMAKATGHPWLFVVWIAPIGLPAFTESPACNALGKQVASFITGNRQNQ
jgi:hypothetical protein